MTPLFKHQKSGIEWLKKLKTGGILADEMGLGKTRQAIVAAGDTSEETNLVVCPASLKENWRREICMVYPEDSTIIVNGSNERLPYAEDAAWIIVNYDILAKNPWLTAMAEAKQIGSLILDEAHYIKDSKAIRSKATLEIAELVPKVYCLTGTPLLNRPIELFSLLRAVKHPLGVGSTLEKKPSISGLKRRFSERYCHGHMRMINLRSGRVLRFWDESGADRIEELKMLVQGYMLRRLKKEVLDLPEKIVSVQELALTKDWQDHYDHAWDEYLEWVKQNPLKKDMQGVLTAQSLVEIVKLRQVCSLAKADRIVADIQNAVEQGEKVIVFSSFTETVHTIEAKLREKKIRSATLTGSDSTDDRQDAVDSFQNDPDCKAFIANIKAGGVGLNLTAASIVMFADFDWSPEVNHQAEDRAHRIGQEGTVNVYYYVLEDTIEADIIDVLQQKQETIGSLTGGDRSNLAFSELLLRRMGLGTTGDEGAGRG